MIQGYPYGNVSAVVDKDTRLGSAWGWGSDDHDENFAEGVKTRAGVQLTEEAYNMFTGLERALANRPSK